MKRVCVILLMVCMLACLRSGAQCTINTGNTMPGITTVFANDTLTKGVLYAQTFQIYIPPTYQGNAIDSVHITVSGAPADLAVVYLPTDNDGETIAGGAQGVICFSGITYDTVGAYPLTFSGTAYMGATTVPLTNLPGNYNYTFYVSAPPPQGYMCNAVMNVNPAYDDTIIIPLSAPNEGFLSGNGAVIYGSDYYPFKAIGEKLTGGIGDSVTGATVEFGYVTINPTDSNKLIGIYVYDDSGPLATGALTGGPGIALDSAFLPLKTIAADVQNQAFSNVVFTGRVKLAKPLFFIVVKLPATTGDTVVIFTNDATTGNGAGYLDITAWYPYTTAAGLTADSLGNFIGATVCGSRPMAPGPGFDALPPSVCLGSIVSFNNSTLGSPTSFSWNFGDGTAGSALLNPTHIFADTGVYIVTLTASNTGGSVTYSAYVKVHGNPAATGTVTNATGVNIADGSVALAVTGGTPQYIFTWSTGADGDTLYTALPGIYEVSITDQKGCLTTDTFTVSYTDGLKGLSSDVLINIFPNPANDILFVQSRSAITRLEIVNMFGQSITANNGTDNFYRLNISGIAPGNYLLLMSTDSGVVRRLFTVVGDK